jgi:hypothetical protein
MYRYSAGMRGLEMNFQLDPTGGHRGAEMAREADVHMPTLNVLNYILSQSLSVTAVSTIPDPPPHLVATIEQLGLHYRIQL